MTQKNRRARSDSITALVAGTQTVQSADDVRLSWPDIVPKFNDAERQVKADEVYLMILEARASQDWKTFDTVMVGHLARELVQYRDNVMILEKTGLLVKGGKHGNTPIRSPYVDLVANNLNRVQSLCRQLGLVSATADPRTVENGRINAAQGAALVSGKINSLLAQPSWAQ